MKHLPARTDCSQGLMQAQECKWQLWDCILPSSYSNHRWQSRIPPGTGRINCLYIKYKSPNIARTLYTCRSLLNFRWGHSCCVTHKAQWPQLLVTAVREGWQANLLPLQEPRDSVGWTWVGKATRGVQPRVSEEEECNTIRKKNHAQNLTISSFFCALHHLSWKRSKNAYPKLFVFLCMSFQRTLQSFPWHLFSMLSAKTVCVCQHLNCS